MTTLNRIREYSLGRMEDMVFRYVDPIMNTSDILWRAIDPPSPRKRAPKKMSDSEKLRSMVEINRAIAEKVSPRIALRRNGSSYYLVYDTLDVDKKYRKHPSASVSPESEGVDHWVRVAGEMLRQYSPEE